jgi:hypothetical protein
VRGRLAARVALRYDDRAAGVEIGLERDDIDVTDVVLVWARRDV